MDPTDLVQKLDYFSAMGKLIGIQQQRYFAPEKIREIIRLTETLFAADKNQGFTPADFKTATGIGRRPAVQILEFFDRSGLTLRQHNYRSMIAAASDIFGD